MVITYLIEKLNEKNVLYKNTSFMKDLEAQNKKYLYDIVEVIIGA